MTVSEHIEAAQVVRERRARREAAERNRAYEQGSLKFVLADVRRHDPAALIDAVQILILDSSRHRYEFRYMEFLWRGTASSVIEARAAGWSAWLTTEGVEGYATA